MQRKQGFPLGHRFNISLWNLWDRLSPYQRQAYEEYYQDKDYAQDSRETGKSTTSQGEE